MSDGSSGGFVEGSGFSGSSCLLSLSVTAELLSVKQGKAHFHISLACEMPFILKKKPLGCGTHCFAVKSHDFEV